MTPPPGFGVPAALDPFGVPVSLKRGMGGGPIIPPPGAPAGGDGVLYKRCTTFIKALDDMAGVSIWKQRMTALGIAKSDELVRALRASTYEDKQVLAEVCETAMQLAGANKKATVGTMLHRLTEIVDAGDELPDNLDARDRADVEAYVEATKRLRKVEAETFVVNDDLKVAGTFDRLVEAPNGSRYIADLKTGRVDKSTFGSQAMQLAVYANSKRYDAATNTRSALNVDTSTGVIVHLPAGTARARLVWLDLAAAWHAVELAQQVWSWRSYSSRVDSRKNGLTPIVLHVEDVA